MTQKSSPCFDIFPQIVCAHANAEITIRPRDEHCGWQDDDPCRVTLIPLEGLPGEMYWAKGEHEERSQIVTVYERQIKLMCAFDSEQEYLLRIETLDEDGVPESVDDLYLYALESDLHALRPFKGDFHLHTHYSDGKESPAYVAARCRQIGLDFIAITDHHQYAPSLEAIQAFALLPIDLCIYPGEEVHPPDNRVHILNFGGCFSINDLFRQERYLSEVNALVNTLPDLPEGVDPYPFASCVWCYDQIRQGGGLGVFCHPYWLSSPRYDVPHSLVDLLFEHQPFDALELIGGYPPAEWESNHLQVARYHELRAAGKRLPVIGVSDSHGCDTGQLFGWYFTLVLAPSSKLPDLITAIKDCQAVAIEALPGELPRAHGPFRLVRYAQFLLREILPQHDDLCREEGSLMLTHLAGDISARSALKNLKGRTTRLYQHLFGE